MMTTIFSPSYYPLLGATTGIITILLCYHYTRSSNHFPPGVTTPPISLLGCRPPERYIYQLGFSLTGIFLLRCIIVEYTNQIHPFWKRKFPKGASVAYLGGVLAAIGSIGQGVVTLEEDFVRKVSGGRSPGESLDPRSIWHQVLALVFFLGAAMHCYVMIYMILFSRNTRQIVENSQQSEDAKASVKKSATELGSSKTLYSKMSCVIKMLCAASTFISWPIAEMLHPLTTNGKNSTGMMSNRDVDLGGLAQYVTVAAYILFFGSYTLDLRSIERRRNSVMSSSSRRKKGE